MRSRSVYAADRTGDARLRNAPQALRRALPRPDAHSHHSLARVGPLRSRAVPAEARTRAASSDVSTARLRAGGEDPRSAGRAAPDPGRERAGGTTTRRVPSDDRTKPSPQLARH